MFFILKRNAYGLPFATLTTKRGLSSERGSDFFSMLPVHPRRGEDEARDNRKCRTHLSLSVGSRSVMTDVALVGLGPVWEAKQDKSTLSSLLKDLVQSKQKCAGPLRSARSKPLVVFFGFPLLPSLYLNAPGHVLRIWIPQNRHHLFSCSLIYLFLMLSRAPRGELPFLQVSL